MPYDIVSELEGQAVGITAHGALSPEEQAQVASYVQGRLDEHGQVHVLVDAGALRREEAEAMLARPLPALPGATRLGRVAIVGEEYWEQWHPYMGARFPAAEFQFFRTPRLAEAWSWVRGKV